MTTTSGAISHLKRTFEYIEHLSESKRTLYSSTKRSIKEMILICEDIIEIGSELIESSNTRCSNLSETNVYNDTSDIELRISNIEKAIKLIGEKCQIYTDKTENPRKDSYDTAVDSSTNINTGKNTKDKSSKNIEDSSRRKAALSVCGQSLNDMDSCIQSNPDNYSYDVQQLSSVINDWYRLRFLNLDKSKSKFRYHIENIPMYIQAIVVDYSNHHSLDSKQDWIAEFRQWLSHIQSNDSKYSDYALPFQTFQVFKDLKDGCNVDNAVKEIWEDIWDSGLSCMIALSPRSVSRNMFRHRVK